MRFSSQKALKGPFADENDPLRAEEAPKGPTRPERATRGLISRASRRRGGPEGADEEEGRTFKLRPGVARCFARFRAKFNEMAPPFRMAQSKTAMKKQRKRGHFAKLRGDEIAPKLSEIDPFSPDLGRNRARTGDPKYGERNEMKSENKHEKGCLGP